MGPISIEGYYDEAFAVPGMLGCIREADRNGADAYIIACFDDTGLDAARATAKAPVIGIGEAGFHVASLIAARFAVVTTLDVSIVPIEHNLRKYGLAERCARVRAAQVPVLALEDRNADAFGKYPRKSRPRSARTVLKPSCSAAPAWPILRPSSRASTACPWSMASRLR